MNVLASECSSGCESGWTFYFEQSFHSPNVSHRNTKFVDGKGGTQGEHFEEKIGKEDDEEEDLSMVSDASSGPPNFHEDEAYFSGVNTYLYPPSKATSQAANSVGKRKKKREHRRSENQEQLPSSLDDTASSPVIMNFSSKNNFTLTNNHASMESVLDYSQGFSATHFQGRSAFQDHYGFLQSSHYGNQFQNNQWL